MTGLLDNRTVIEVFIEGLEFYGYHGVPDAERETGHRFKVDLSMMVRSDAEQTDEVRDTADYGKTGIELVRIGEETKYRTLERIAHEMARHVLDSQPLVDAVKISIRKMLPPAPIIAAACGVTLELRR